MVVCEISMYNLRSSAKSLALTEGLRWSVISLMNKLKSKGPKQLPCGTPAGDKTGHS